MTQIFTDVSLSEAAPKCFAGTSDVSEIDDAVVFGRELGFAGVDELCRTNGVAENGAEVVEIFEKILTKARCDFDFVGEEFSGAFFNKIDFLLGLVSVKEQGVGACGRGKPAFEKFEDDEIFKKSPALRMRFELFGRFDTEQPAGQSGIAHVEFGALNDGFPDVAEKRGQANNDVRSFKNGCPRLNGLDAYSEGFRECARIELAPDRGGAEPDKIAECAQIADFFHLADIPLDVGFVVVGKNIAGNGIRLPNGGKSAFENQFVNIGIRRDSGEFREREREQLRDCDASGERLRNIFHEQKITASGENKFAGTIFIDKHLRRRKKLGNALRLINDCAVGSKGAQKRLRVGFRRVACHRQLQIGVSVAGKSVFAERGFPRLAWSRDAQNRELLLKTREFRCQIACDEGAFNHSENKSYFMNFFNINL